MCILGITQDSGPNLKAINISAKTDDRFLVCFSGFYRKSYGHTHSHLLEWKGLAEWSESNTLQTSVVLEAPEAGGGVSGVLGEFGAEAVLSVSLSGILL